MKKLITLALFVSMTFAHIAKAETGVTDSKILIGQSAAFSGANAELGEKYSAGAKAYFDFTNANGGVYGRKIELITKDDGYDPARTAENTKQLIDNDGVFGLFGYVGTPTSMAAVPIFTQKKVPFFAPFSGAMSLRQPMNRYIFNVRASYCDEVSKSISQMGPTSVKLVGVIYQNDSYGQSVLACVKEALQKQGAEPKVTATVERNSLDVANAINTVSAANPMAVIIASGYKSTAKMITELKKNSQIVGFYNVSFVGVQQLADEMGGGNGRGVVVTQVVPPPNTDMSEEAKYLKKELGKDVSYTAYEGFLAAKTFVIGLKRAGRDLTRESFINGLERDEIDLGNMHLHYTASNHMGSGFVESTMISYNGKIAF
jgi:ABC-type branched-subunit amino acid transport system substrate-binding protein